METGISVLNHLLRKSLSNLIRDMVFFMLWLIIYTRCIYISEHLSLVLGVNVVPSHCLSHYSPPTEALEMVKVLLLENLSEFKEEVCNSLEFAETLSSGVNIFVNDSFSQSHKVLASTVGITRFCYSSIAGFHFEESLRKLKDVVENDKRPHIAIVCSAVTK